MLSEAVDVDHGQFVARVAAVGGGISARRMSADRMPISRGIPPLADIPDREGGDGGPELVIRGEHPVIAMPVLPRRRQEIGRSSFRTPRSWPAAGRAGGELAAERGAVIWAVVDKISTRDRGWRVLSSTEA